MNMKDFTEVLTVTKGSIEKALPAQMEVGLFLRAATQYALTPRNQAELFKCTKQSIGKALLDAATMGLVPDGTLGSAYLIRYGNECRMMPGYRGLIDLVRRAGAAKKLEAHVVREGDHFRYAKGTDPRIEHTPDPEGQGEITHAYAVAWLPDGDTQFEVLTRQDLEKIKNVSKAKGGPWKDWPEEMARKSAVRRLVKYLPMSAKDLRLQMAIEADNRAAGEDDQIRDVEAREKPTSGVDALASAIGVAEEEAPPEVVDVESRPLEPLPQDEMTQEAKEWFGQ